MGMSMYQRFMGKSIIIDLIQPSPPQNREQLKKAPEVNLGPSQSHAHMLRHMCVLDTHKGKTNAALTQCSWAPPSKPACSVDRLSHLESPALFSAMQWPLLISHTSLTFLPNPRAADAPSPMGVRQPSSTPHCRYFLNLEFSADFSLGQNYQSPSAPIWQ